MGPNCVKHHHNRFAYTEYHSMLHMPQTLEHRKHTLNPPNPNIQPSPKRTPEGSYPNLENYPKSKTRPQVSGFGAWGCENVTLEPHTAGSSERSPTQVALIEILLTLSLGA